VTAPEHEPRNAFGEIGARNPGGQAIGRQRQLSRGDTCAEKHRQILDVGAIAQDRVGQTRIRQVSLRIQMTRRQIEDRSSSLHDARVIDVTHATPPCRIDRVALLCKPCVVVDGLRRDNEKTLGTSERFIEGFWLVEIAVPNADAERSKMLCSLRLADAHAELRGQSYPQELRNDARPEAPGRARYNYFPVVVCHLVSSCGLPLAPD
jgi:hypothetical protein